MLLVVVLLVVALLSVRSNCCSIKLLFDQIAVRSKYKHTARIIILGVALIRVCVVLCIVGV